MGPVEEFPHRCYTKSTPLLSWYQLSLICGSCWILSNRLLMVLEPKKTKRASHFSLLGPLIAHRSCWVLRGHRKQRIKQFLAALLVSGRRLGQALQALLHGDH